MASEAGGGARRPSVSDRGGRVQHRKYLLSLSAMPCPVLLGMGMGMGMLGRRALAAVGSQAAWTRQGQGTGI